MRNRGLVLRLLALTGLVAIIANAVGGAEEKFSGFLDLRAAQMVFLAPICVLLVFQGEVFQIRTLVRRAREVLAMDFDSLAMDLEKNTLSAMGAYGYAHLLRMSESHSDSMVRYGGELISSQFKTDEVARLMTQRAQAEDQRWYQACAAFGFLAKMAPYFGMLATVIGMIKLLESLNDFTKISGSMAMALLGTLYGLVSFLLVYSPMQKLLTSWRESILRRNEMVVRWFVMVAQRTDSVYIQEQLRTQRTILAVQEQVIS